MNADAIAMDLMPIAAPAGPAEPTVEAAPEPARADGRRPAARELARTRRPVRPLARFGQAEESPSFYLSLSDLMSLLLVFFVLIFSLSDHGKSEAAPAPKPPVVAQKTMPAAPRSLMKDDPGGWPAIDAAPDDASRAAMLLASAAQGDPELTEKPQPATPPRPEPIQSQGLEMDRALLSMIATSTTAPSEAVPQDEVNLQDLLEQVWAAAGAGLPGAEIPAGLQVAATDDKLIIRLPENITFDLGQAAIKPAMGAILGGLAPVVLRNGACQVIITGHTDDLPISTPQFASNWELSAARAAAVARALTSHGVPAERINIRGMADQAPLVPNDGPANRQLNRRVEIELRTKG